MSGEMRKEAIEPFPLLLIFYFPRVAPEVKHAAGDDRTIEERFGKIHPIAPQSAQQPVPGRTKCAALHHVPNKIQTGMSVRLGGGRHHENAGTQSRSIERKRGHGPAGEETGFADQRQVRRRELALWKAEDRARFTSNLLDACA